MHKKNLALLAGAVQAVCLGAVQAAVAQETTVFEPVIVTAQKREQNIYEVPVAISAFTAETMERQGISDLTDIGKFVPNLNVTGFSAGHTVKIERSLLPLFPQERWTMLSHLLIEHGRQVCDARKPRCGDCLLADVCPSALV